MKKLIMAIIFISMCISIQAPVSFAADRIFEWDQNSESDLKGYKIYRAAAPNVDAIPGNLWLTIYKPGENPDPGDAANAEYIVGPSNQCVLPRNILPDGTYYFVLTAFDNALNESGKSNEVSTIIDDTAPAPPNGFQCNQP